MKPGKGFRDWGTARNKMHLQVFSLMVTALLAGFGQGQGYMQTNRRKKKKRRELRNSSPGASPSSGNQTVSG